MNQKSTKDPGVLRQFYSQDLQLQSIYSDGRDTIAALIEASIARGRRTIGITDHAIGWDDGDEHCRFFKTGAEFKRYLDELTDLKRRYSAQGITILAGLEVEIGLDGTMALAPGILEVIGSEEAILEYVDYVIGVIHSESFAVSINALGKTLTDEEKATYLVQNVAALIANPRVLIWGHPFQAIHGHLLRHFNSSEQAAIIASLRERKQPLLLEYNLNPTPRYYEWGGKSTHYASGKLQPNDQAFFDRCIDELQSHFVVSTDAHDVAQTGRLQADTDVPANIRQQLTYLNVKGEPQWN